MKERNFVIFSCCRFTPIQSVPLVDDDYNGSMPTISSSTYPVAVSAATVSGGDVMEIGKVCFCF